MRLHDTRRNLTIVSLGLLMAGLAAFGNTTVRAAEFEDETDKVRYRRATFVLGSGETIADVPFVVDERFHVISLETAEGERNLSFADIGAVYDGDRDITEVILGRPAAPAAVKPAISGSEPALREAPTPEVPVGAPEPVATVAPDTTAVPVESVESVESVEPAETVAEPGPQTWLSENDPVYVKRNAPLWKLGLRLAGHYSNPVGDYYEGIGAGFGYEGDILIGLQRTISLRLSLAHTSLGTDDLSLAAYDPYPPTTNETWNMDVWRFSFAAQAQKPLTARKGELGMLYLYAGVGAIWQELSVDFELAGSPRHLDYDETKLLMTLGGGVLKMISRTVGIDVAGEMGVVFVGGGDGSSYSYSYYGDTQTALLLDLKLGLVKLFD